jgi:hypothetical protein
MQDKMITRRQLMDHLKHIANFRCLGVRVTNQNCIQKEIQNCMLPPSRIFYLHVLSKNIKLQYKNINLPVVYMVVKFGLLHYGKNIEWEESQTRLEDTHNEERRDLYPVDIIMRDMWQSRGR